MNGSEGFRSPTSFVNLQGIFDEVEEVGDLGYKWDIVSGRGRFKSPTCFVNLEAIFDRRKEVRDSGLRRYNYTKTNIPIIFIGKTFISGS
ncbi:MAG: hypothetical protein RLZZ29_1892 [Cyanobacteriota bacterium]